MRPQFVISSFMNNFIPQQPILTQLLQQQQKIVISSHANPDGDALGSSLALYHYLKTLGHEISVIMPTELPDFLNWMPDFDKVLVSYTQAELCKQAIEQATIIFSLDYNALSRVNEVGEWIGSSTAYKVMIDHHLEPENFANAQLWRTSASSTCELVYDFFELLGVWDKVSLEACNCLFVGILTDTGGFRHATSPRLFRVVANILEKGVDNNLISDLVFNDYTVKRFRLLVYCLSQRLELLENLNAGIIGLSLFDHNEWDIKRGDLEGVVNYILKIKKLQLAAIVTERKEGVKLSLRSKGDYSVQEICKKHFNGGGHRNASGGSSSENLRQTVQKLKDIIAQNPPIG